MGIFWSCCEDNEEVCHGCSRRGLQLTNNECQFCRNSRLATYVRSLEVPRPMAMSRLGHSHRSLMTEKSDIHNTIKVPRSTPAYRRPHAKAARPGPAYVIPKKEKRGPLFGDYRCSCGRTWKSRRSWLQKTKTCMNCHKEVYAHTQRELRPEDMEKRSQEAGKLDHPEELCEMCQELGYYCGKYKY